MGHSSMFSDVYRRIYTQSPLPLSLPLASPLSLSISLATTGFPLSLIRYHAVAIKAPDFVAKMANCSWSRYVSTTGFLAASSLTADEILLCCS